MGAASTGKGDFNAVHRTFRYPLATHCQKGGIVDAMNSDAHKENKRIDYLFTLVVLLFATYFLQDRFALNAFYDGIATPIMLFEGEAYLPFQTRALVLWVAATLHRYLFFESLNPLQLFAVFDFVFTILLLFVTRRFLFHLIQDYPMATCLSCLLFYIMPFHLTKTMWYPWDIPTMIFMTLGMMYLYQWKWLPFYLVFVLSTMNRETTILLTCMMVLSCFRKMPFSRLCLHVLIQVLVWLLIRYCIFRLYALNPKLGYGTFEYQLWKNIALLQNPKIWIKALSAFGYLWVPILFYYPRIKNDFVRLSLWLVPPVYGILFVIGVVYELRIYVECIPIVLAANVVLIHQAFIQRVKSDFSINSVR